MKTKSNMTDKKPKELDWEKTLENCRGYDCSPGESFIVFEDTNEIWDSYALVKYIKSLLTQQRTELFNDLIKIVEEQLFWYKGEDYGSITAREALNQVKNLLNKKNETK